MIEKTLMTRSSSAIAVASGSGTPYANGQDADDAGLDDAEAGRD